MALPNLQRKLFKNDGYGPDIKDERLSTDITVKDWDASHDYPANVLAKAGGEIYRSVAASGPGAAAGAQDPAADDGTYWTAVPTDDADIVHKSGPDVLTGVKTFASSVDFSGNGNNFASDLVIATPNFKAVDGYYPYSQFGSLQFTDNGGYLTADGTSLSRIEVETPSPENSYCLTTYIGNRNFAVGMDTYPAHVFRIMSFKSGNHLSLLGTRSGILAASPVFHFFSEGAPKKGTLPAGNYYSVINFDGADDIDDEISNGTNIYGQIGSCVQNSGTTYVFFDTRKNEANSSSFGRVMLTYALDNTVAFRPWNNNFIDLGISSQRWKNIYTNASAINGSDERIKDSIDSIPDAVLDAWGDVGFVQFKMKESVKEKGAAARLHSGLIAQRIEAAFAERGLNAAAYGLFCHDEWDADPSLEIEGGDLYSLRYEEALCMEAAYQRRRADRAEARIAFLEARLDALEAKLNG